MSASHAQVKNVVIRHDMLTVELTDERVLSAPLTWRPTLLQATGKQPREWKTGGAGGGVHWPALDYRLSVDGLLRGAHEAEGVTRRLVAVRSRAVWGEAALVAPSSGGGAGARRREGLWSEAGAQARGSAV